MVRVVGPDSTVRKTFGQEGGIHRWQGLSKGKTQTSSITIAVLPEAKKADVQLDPNEIEITATRGSGKGGQHRNKKDTCIVVKHIPTGITARIQSERSQSHNKEQALALVRSRLLQAEKEGLKDQRDRKRRKQVRGGKRGEKRRTIQEQNDLVTDHVSGKKMKLKRYLKGYIEDLARG